MSTLNEGSGTPVEPTAHGDSDTPIPQVPNPAGAARQQGNGNGSQAAPQSGPDAAAGGLPGLAGFAQTDAYALQQGQAAPEPEPEPEPEAPALDMPPLIPDPAAPAGPAVTAATEVAEESALEMPVLEESGLETALPEEAAAEEPVLRQDEPVLPRGEPIIPPLSQSEMTPDQLPQEDATFEQAFAASDDAEAELEQVWQGDTPEGDFSAMDAVAPEAVPDEAGEPAPDDDFSAFSKDSLERFLAGEGTLPSDEPAGEPPAGDEAFAPEPDLEAAYTGDAAGDADDQAATDLQAFQARYDQHPEIPIGDAEVDEDAAPVDEPFFDQEPEVDADFLESDTAEPAAGETAGGKGNKRTIMIASALVGSLAMGGALAFAYKNSDALLGGSGEPPLIQADNKPVKQTPAEPGGKQFPHKNKLIYDRLQGEETPEVEKLVPRQEEVAAAVQDNAAAVAKTETGAPGASGETATPGSEGPKKVKTLVVRPDGTVMQSPQSSTQTATAPAQDSAVPAVPSIPQVPDVPAPPAAASAGQTAAQPPVAQPERKPTPPQATQPRVAAAPAPRPRAASSGGKYVVQVAARKSQTDALAAFADLQQKYPSLLRNYRPIIERADLGSKGVWYRLRVGPLNQKTSAANLCSKLKSAGMSSCLVRSYSGS